MIRGPIRRELRKTAINQRNTGDYSTSKFSWEAWLSRLSEAKASIQTLSSLSRTMLYLHKSLCGEWKSTALCAWLCHGHSNILAQRIRRKMRSKFWWLTTSADRKNYRISLRSSSLWEPRHPLLKVLISFSVKKVYILFATQAVIIYSHEGHTVLKQWQCNHCNQQQRIASWLKVYKMPETQKSTE